MGRFFAEARAASVIKHPGIVEVLDCDVYDGRAYIVMELLRGESLRDYLERVESTGRDEAGSLQIFLQIASALAAAHAQEIIHRDLKPDNIFLHVSENQAPNRPIAKVLDFGIAKLMGGGEGGTKTRTGQLLGTPMYMSPEQCRGAKQIDSRSDIYSLGCIMYETLCGKAPFLDEGFRRSDHRARVAPVGRSRCTPRPGCRRRRGACCSTASPRIRPIDHSRCATWSRGSGSSFLRRRSSSKLRCRSRRARTAGSGPGPDRAPVPGSRRPRRCPRGAGAISSSGGTLAAPREDSVMPARPASRGSSGPAHAPAATTTPSGVGRTRVLAADGPSTLTESAVEHFKTVPRTRGAGSKVAIALASVAAVALAAVVIVRVLTGQSTGGDEKQTTAESDSTGANANRTTPVANAAGTTAGETEHAQPAHPQPPPPPAISVITLLGLPPQALVRLDGQVVTPPVAVARGSEPHHLIVDANGYQRWETSFDARTDHTLAVEMKPCDRAAGQRARRPYARTSGAATSPRATSPASRA